MLVSLPKITHSLCIVSVERQGESQPFLFPLFHISSPAISHVRHLPAVWKAKADVRYDSLCAQGENIGVKSANIRGKGQITGQIKALSQRVISCRKMYFTVKKSCENL